MLQCANKSKHFGATNSNVKTLFCYKISSQFWVEWKLLLKSNHLYLRISLFSSFPHPPSVEFIPRARLATVIGELELHLRFRPPYLVIRGYGSDWKAGTSGSGKCSIPNWMPYTQSLQQFFLNLLNKDILTVIFRS